MQKNKLNLHICGIHLLNPYKTVVSHLKQSRRRRERERNVTSRFCDHFSIIQREQWWRSGESTRLPPMCPGFDFQTRCHMWVEFVGSLLFSALRDFPPGTPVSPFPQNLHLMKFDLMFVHDPTSSEL